MEKWIEARCITFSPVFSKELIYWDILYYYQENNSSSETDDQNYSRKSSPHIVLNWVLKFVEQLISVSVL